MPTITRTVAVKATVQQTHSLGAWFFQQGHSPEQTLAWLKAKSYTVRGVKFNAAYVANFVAGMRAVVDSVTSGQATCTKAKGYTVKPTKAVAVEPVVAKAPIIDVAVDDEVPF